MAWLELCCRHRYTSGFELDVKFDAGAGVTALVGPSGSGKSTVLACIAGVLRPDSGRLALDGMVLFDVQQNRFVPPERRGIGIVFQDRLLFPHLTARENLEFGLRRKPARSLEFAHLIDVLDLGDLLPRYPHTLSGGEKQRVALGRAILCGPRMLLLDEPLTALDNELKERVLEYLQRVIVEYHLPTLLVSHGLKDVSHLADATIQIRAGSVVD
jgi:molybdate transport system ATP-binding protein